MSKSFEISLTFAVLKLLSDKIPTTPLL